MIMFDLIVMMFLSCNAYFFFNDMDNEWMKYVFVAIPMAIGFVDILHNWGVW